MSWITNDTSTELMDSSLSHGWQLFQKKKLDNKHLREVKNFLKTISWFEFQELLELWSRLVSRKKDIAISSRSESFYKSPEWRKLRYLKLSTQKTCELCGWGSRIGKRLHVDHVKG